MKTYPNILKLHALLLVVLVAFALPNIITGCAAPVSSRTMAGRSLETITTGVHAAMNTYGVLYRAKKVSEADRANILAVYEDYQEAATLANVALNYDQSKPTGPQVEALADTLIALINQLQK